jgi:hypothetical protein
MKTKISRRTSLSRLLLGIPFIGMPRKSKPIHQKVVWLKLTNEKLGPGDMWAKMNPNTPERQAEGNYNLQMQAVHPTQYGKAPGDNCNNGWHWRPVRVIES